MFLNNRLFAQFSLSSKVNRRWFPAIVKYGLAALILLLVVACQDTSEDVPQEPANVRTSYDGALPPDALARLGKGAVNALAFSNDGRKVAAGGDVGLYLYDAGTLEEIWQIPAVSSIISLAFSPGDQWLAAGSENGSLSLIDAGSGEIARSTPANGDEWNGVQSLAWSNEPADEGLLLAAGFNDGYVAVSRLPGEPGADQDLSEIEILGLLQRLPRGASALAFNPKGNVLATGDRTGRVNLWETETLQWFGFLDGEEQGGAVQSLSWSPDGACLLSSGAKGDIVVWDTLTFEPMHRLTHSATVLGASYSPDGDSFATAGENGTIITWDAEDPAEDPITGQVPVELQGIAWSPDGGKFAAITADGRLSLWPLAEKNEDAEPLVSLLGHGKLHDLVAAGAWSHDGQKLASGAGDDVHIWDVRSDTLDKILSGHTSAVEAIAWSPDGDQLASAGGDQSIIIWDLETTAPRLTLNEHTRAVSDLAWSPDGTILASAGSLDDTVILWDPESGQALHRLPGQGDGVWSVAWSPDGNTLVVGTTGGMILFWDMSDQVPDQPGKALRRHLNWIADLDFSSDGTMLASAGADNKVVLTRLGDEKARSFSGHLGPVRQVHFNPDGQRMASAGRDGLVIIWDVEAGEPLSILDGHTDSANAVSWSPDGGLLASGSDDGTVILWEVGP